MPSNHPPRKSIVRSPLLRRFPDADNAERRLVLDRRQASTVCVLKADRVIRRATISLVHAAASPKDLRRQT
jgi:hypothetical protein